MQHVLMSTNVRLKQQQWLLVEMNCNSKQDCTPPSPWTSREWNLNMFFNILCWCGSFFGTTKLPKSNVARIKNEKCNAAFRMCKWQLAWLDTRQSSMSWQEYPKRSKQVQKYKHNNTKRILRKQMNDHNPTFLYQLFGWGCPSQEALGVMFFNLVCFFVS